MQEIQEENESFESDFESDKALLEHGFTKIGEGIFAKSREIYGRCHFCNFICKLPFNSLKGNTITWICSPCLNGDECKNGHLLQKTQWN